jgi:hypothetical protein
MNIANCKQPQLGQGDNTKYDTHRNASATHTQTTHRPASRYTNKPLSPHTPRVQTCPYQPYPAHPSPTNRPTTTNTILSRLKRRPYSFSLTLLRWSTILLHTHTQTISLTLSRAWARRSAGARNPKAATPAHKIGGTILPSGLVPTNSCPSRTNFPSRRRRRLKKNWPFPAI